MHKSLTEQWTEKSFTNEDGDKLKISHCEEKELREIKIEDGVFWFPVENGKDIAEAILAICSDEE